MLFKYSTTGSDPKLQKVIETIDKNREIISSEKGKTGSDQKTTTRQHEISYEKTQKINGNYQKLWIVTKKNYHHKRLENDQQ